MKIIPVIDIKDQQVVHAKKGQRNHYRPIKSDICPHSDINSVVDSFLHLAHFNVIYIADLDAIMNTGENDKQLINCLQQFPDVQFWIDHGGRFSLRGYTPNNYRPVIGSENLTELGLDQLKQQNKTWLLSLDHNDKGRIGPVQIFENPEYWPNQVILMTLSQVGSGNGPDWELINNYRSQFPKQQFVAAGGIRDMQDILKLQQLGIEEVLISSALHNTKIGAKELALLNF